MPQSLSNLLVHIVFSTKERVPFLQRVELRAEMHKVLGGTSKTLNCPPVIVGGVSDHVHLLARQARTMAVSEWVKELKRVSSLWANDHIPAFEWQAGYGAFSVSQSLIGRVVEYIENQEAHHRAQDFQSEFRKLLEKHGIEYDERYVWD